MRRTVCLCLTAGLLLAVAAQPARALTDREVVKAIEKGQNWLKGKQGGNGSWPEKKWYHATGNYGHTEIALFTLVYTGVHPNRPVVEKGLRTLLARNLDYTYAISMRCMAYAYIQRKLSDKRRDAVRKAMKLDALWLCQAQGSHGGWDYKSLGGSGGRYDLSNTQMAILALREAALAGCEIPDIVWNRAQGLYFRLQQKDGSWNYGEHSGHRGKGKPGYGSMTAAGLASIFITMDNLNLASGCPCRGGRSKRAGSGFDRRVDAALAWLEKHFNPRKNPKDPGNQYHYYW
ncbi:MAG: hypothetical protein U9R68_02560, partial [Planctomycetota bacterium]|nr:hypothetical protein [Planctomycetota bacterium]